MSSAVWGLATWSRSTTTLEGQAAGGEGWQRLPTEYEQRRNTTARCHAGTGAADLRGSGGVRPLARLRMAHVATGGIREARAEPRADPPDDRDRTRDAARPGQGPEKIHLAGRGRRARSRSHQGIAHTQGRVRSHAPEAHSRWQRRRAARRGGAAGLERAAQLGRPVKRRRQVVQDPSGIRARAARDREQHQPESPLGRGAAGETR
jgi:hypothetical protein